MSKSKIPSFLKVRQSEIFHIHANLSFDFESRTIEGNAQVKLRPTSPNAICSLGGINFEISKILINDKDSDYDYNGKIIQVTMPPEIMAFQATTLQIFYKASPRFGMHWLKSPYHEDQYFVTTCGEGGLHPNWIPVYPGMDQRFTSEMCITVPQPYKAISNGTLIKSIQNEDNTTTWHWLQNTPHANYLIALYIGNYEYGSLGTLDGVPIGFWVPEGRKKEGEYAFRNTIKMMSFFNEILGMPYPWNKYDQIASPDYAGGALEHTTVTGQSDTVLRLENDGSPLDHYTPFFNEYYTTWTAEAVISHELSHHWFGNCLTSRDLGYIFLHEGFATYMMMLWAEKSQGFQQLLFDVNLARDSYLAATAGITRVRPLEYHEFTCAEDAFDVTHAYLKAGVVMHMLRKLLGDNHFFSSIQHYLRNNFLKTVTTKSFEQSISDNTGINITWFFNQWVRGGGHPVLTVSYRYLQSHNVIELTVAQVQAPIANQAIFSFPVTIQVITDTASTTWEIWVSSENEVFLLPCHEKPLMIGFDSEGDLVAEITFDKSAEELIYQIQHDGLIGQLRALKQIGERYNDTPSAIDAVEKLIQSECFWALKAEALRQYGKMSSVNSMEIFESGLKEEDYRIRKGVVLGLASFKRCPNSLALLKKIIVQDANHDVIGAALVALARSEKQDVSFYTRIMSRKSWNKEFNIACMTAMSENSDVSYLPLIRSQAKPGQNEHLRNAAFQAWARTAPNDSELHIALIESAKSTPYLLQMSAIELLGQLTVIDSVATLEFLVKADADQSVVENAKKALHEISRIQTYLGQNYQDKMA